METMLATMLNYHVGEWCHLYYFGIPLQWSRVTIMLFIPCCTGLSLFQLFVKENKRGLRYVRIRSFGISAQCFHLPPQNCLVRKFRLNADDWCSKVTPISAFSKSVICDDDVFFSDQVIIFVLKLIFSC